MSTSFLANHNELEEAHYLLHLLANCDCLYIPASLLVRPYLPTRRWTDEGRIEISHRPSYLSPWLSEIFENSEDASEAPSFPRESVGAKESNRYTELVSISAPFARVFNPGVRWLLKDDWLVFEVGKEWKTRYRAS